MFVGVRYVKILKCILYGRIKMIEMHKSNSYFERSERLSVTQLLSLLCYSESRSAISRWLEGVRSDREGGRGRIFAGLDHN